MGRALFGILMLVGAASSTCAEIREAREMGDAIGKELVRVGSASFKLAQRESHDDLADYIALPGNHHYVAGWGTQGPQLHYFSPELGETHIVGDVELEGETMRWTFAQYRGPPPPPEDAARLHLWRPPGGIVVTVVTRTGEPREGVGIRIENADGSNQRMRKSDHDGGVRFLDLGADTWFVRREITFLFFAPKRTEVQVPAGQVVHLVRDPSGFRVARDP